MFDTLIEINFSPTQAIDSYTCCSISDTNIDILFIEKLIKRDLIIIIVVVVVVIVIDIERGNVLLPIFNYSESDYSFALHVAELLIQISSSSMHKCFMCV